MDKNDAAVMSVGLLAAACCLCFLIFRVTGCEASRMQASVDEAKAAAVKEQAKTDRVKEYAKLGDKLIVIEAEQP